ncbi:DUF2637 domain-containing protein [Kitasatospora sp. KL5]|uniref:DUF2637 domain-containing protein n=1 Tax=Kitasatospora sp. KL5 TaxID=3425125 RepID=UPI003D6E830F
MRLLIGVVALGAATIAGIGFVGSYGTLQKLGADNDLGTFSYAFPIGVDVGIVVLLALDLVLTWLGIKFALLRRTAWLLTGATVAFNAASGYPKILPMALHAVIPLLFIVVVEGARVTIARMAALEAGTELMEGVRFFRWLLAPRATFSLWRRMKLWEITSYREIVDLEQNRMAYRAILKHEYGRGWRRKAPMAALLPLKLAKYGRAVPELEPPETEFSAKYAPKVTLERADRPTDPAAPALPAGLPAELLEWMDALVTRVERVETTTAPVAVEPSRPAALNKGAGIVPLGIRSPKPATTPSPWFGGAPQQPQPVSDYAAALAEMGQAPAPQPQFDPWAEVSRPQAAEFHRPEVHARIPQQQPELVEQPQPVEPVADLEYAVPEAEPVEVLEPTEPGVEQLEEGPQAGPVDGPKLSNKLHLVQLYGALSPEDLALPDLQLAEKLAPKIGATVGTTRKYIGQIKSGRLG